MSEVKAVIFDMDGLMFDTEPIYYQANQNAADELGLPYSFETYKQFIGCGDKEYRSGMKKIFSNYGDEKVDAFFKISNDQLENELKYGEVKLKNGLLELLEYLKKEKIEAFVASSTNRNLVDSLLNRLDVQKYFKDVIGGSEVKKAKPDPEIFNRAFEQTKLKNKKEVLILEDSKNGVKAAYSAGIPVVVIPDLVKPDDETHIKAEQIYSNLSEVIKYIKRK